MNDEARDLVLEACHALAAYGLGPGIGGHVSIRVPGKSQYWVNALDRAFEEMTEDDIVLMDFDGSAVVSSRPISPGIGFHPGIYSLRPDIAAIIHTHGYWITAQSAFGRPPKTFHNLATYFFDRTAVAPDDEIESIAPALRPDDVAVVIPWHGAITIGRDIGEAAALHVVLDYACRLDVMLANSGAPEMPENVQAHIQRLLGQANHLELTWGLMRRKATRAFNGEVIVPAAIS